MDFVDHMDAVDARTHDTRPMTHDSQTQNGFTLLEILVAVILLGLTLATVLELFSGSLNLAAVSEEYARAAVLGQRKMNQVLLNKELFEQESASDSGVFESGIEWDVTIELYEGIQDEEDEEGGLDLLSVKVFSCLLRIHWESGRHTRSIDIRALKTVPKGSIEFSSG